MKKHLILILPLLIGCAAPLYHCEKEYNYTGEIWQYQNREYTPIVNGYYAECYPERKDTND